MERMKSYVQICEEASGQFSAQWPGLPDSRVVATSREAALTELVRRVDQLVKNGSLVEVELNGAALSEPCDEKTLDGMYLDEIRKHREELDAREGVWKVDHLGL